MKSFAITLKFVIKVKVTNKFINITERGKLSGRIKRDIKPHIVEYISIAINILITKLKLIYLITLEYKPAL